MRSGTSPGRTVNLFSGASADAALLDVFCLTDAEKIEGQVNLNTRNPVVLAALLSGAIGKYTQGTSLDAAQAAQVASALTSFTAHQLRSPVPPNWSRSS